jgi:hypothetical protein
MAVSSARCTQMSPTFVRSSTSSGVLVKASAYLFCTIHQELWNKRTVGEFH